MATIRSISMRAARPSRFKRFVAGIGVGLAPTLTLTSAGCQAPGAYTGQRTREALRYEHPPENPNQVDQRLAEATGERIQPRRLSVLGHGLSGLSVGAEATLSGALTGAFAVVEGVLFNPDIPVTKRFAEGAFKVPAAHANAVWGDGQGVRGRAKGAPPPAGAGELPPPPSRAGSYDRIANILGELKREIGTAIAQSEAENRQIAEANEKARREFEAKQAERDRALKESAAETEKLKKLNEKFGD